MKIWKSRIYIAALLLGVSVGASAGLLDFFKSGTSEALQHDFDIVRLNDLVQLSGLIEQYKNKAGIYPLEGQTDLQHYVHIATKEQQEYAQGGPPYKHKRTDVGTFISELQSVLGPNIEIPFDLQRVPVKKPNFYIYMVIGDIYYLAVHVHQDFSFANKLADFYNKVEVTNSPQRRKGLWLREDLIGSEAYVAVTSEELIKPDYVKELRGKLGGNSAF